MGLEITPIVRTQDFSVIKQNEDNKSALDQGNISNAVADRTLHESRQVTDSQDSSWHQRKQDASEKGANAYSGDGGAKRRKEKEKTVERVAVKGRSGGFDIKV